MESAKMGMELRRKIIARPEMNPEVSVDPTIEPNRSNTIQYATDEKDLDTNDDTVPWEDEPISWDDVREEVIPSYVTKVTFTVADENLTPDHRKELEERFRGTIIQTSKPEVELVPVATKHVEKPKGVKNAIFELDPVELEIDPAIEQNIRRIYPWASLQTEKAENVLPSVPPSMADYDPQQFLYNFARYITDRPEKHEFPYAADFRLRWASLPFDTKVAIAHARAIEQECYGKVQLQDQCCTHCSQQDFTCKVYRSDVVASSPHMNLGHACQRCRLLGRDCDVGIPGHGYAFSHARIGSSSSENMDSRMRHVPVDVSSEATDTSPEPVVQRRDLASRITRDDASFRGNSEKNGRRSDMPSSGVPVQAESPMIEAVAGKLGLKISRPEVLLSIYTEWSDTKRIRPYRDTYVLDHYYAKLVELYIIAMSDLQYALLIEFQTTNFCNKHPSKLPTISTVVKAYRYLSHDTPLCRWIAIVYSYFGYAPIYENYESFRRHYNGLEETAAATRFIHSILRIRCNKTPDHKAAALKQWCKVHSHTPSSNEDRLCRNTRANNMLSVNRAIQDDNKRQTEEATSVVKRHDGIVVTSALQRSEKRKAEGPIERGSLKKIHVGSGLGRGRGRGDAFGR
jgi:hypothetical protein